MRGETEGSIGLHFSRLSTPRTFQGPLPTTTSQPDPFRTPFQMFQALFTLAHCYCLVDRRRPPFAGHGVVAYVYSVSYSLSPGYRVPSLWWAPTLDPLLHVLSPTVLGAGQEWSTTTNYYRSPLKWGGKRLLSAFGHVTRAPLPPSGGVFKSVKSQFKTLGSDPFFITCLLFYCWFLKTSKLIKCRINTQFTVDKCHGHLHLIKMLE